MAVGARVASVWRGLRQAAVSLLSLRSPAHSIRQVSSTLCIRCRNLDVTKDEAALGSDPHLDVVQLPQNSAGGVENRSLMRPRLRNLDNFFLKQRTESYLQIVPAGEMAEAQSEFCRVVDSMSSSIRAARETTRTLLEKCISSFYY